MSKNIRIDRDSSIALPREALEALDVDVESEVDVEIVGRAVVIRSLEDAQRSREFGSAFESILTKRRTAYQELAKGPNG